MNASARAIEQGESVHLGAHYDGRGTNFALFSAHGEKVELCLFDMKGKRELQRLTLPGRTGDIHHGYVPGLKPGQVYGYRVHGPYDPANGHFFNPHKLLFDPYARDIAGNFEWTDLHYGYDRNSPGGLFAMDTRDNAASMIKARVTAPASTKQRTRPHISWQDSVIYETHIKGMTMKFPGLDKTLRGTAAGFGSPQVASYLKSLGVTAVELLPVHAHVDEHRLNRMGLRNYWGYNTIGFFAPEPSLGSPEDFRAMVDNLHDAGIEVILDVVYNHSCESDETGPTLSFRGIDNASYYRMDPQRGEHCLDFTGCGNTLNADHPMVRRLILDSLRYWVKDMEVDGFRFDLAVTPGRENPVFSSRAAFFREIAADPALSRVKLIAEPWDVSAIDSYQLGNFPPEWREWNDRFRNDTRRFWRGDTGTIGALADRIAGSRAVFGHKSSSPSSSINFVTAHDGFTMADLVSYDFKKNHANGEDNWDGSDDNNSCNHGAEGPTDDPAIHALRLRQTANFMTSLLLSQGTPMLTGGDEFGNSQDGNNNAYCQDNEAGWLDWRQDADAKALTGFVSALIALRGDNPVLRHPEFLNGFNRCAHGEPDIEWFIPEGRVPVVAEWQDPGRRCLGVMLNNGALKTAEAANRQRLLLLFNAHAHAVDFKLPALRGGEAGWRRALDTSRLDLRPGADPAPLPQGSTLPVPGRTGLVLTQAPA